MNGLAEAEAHCEALLKAQDRDSWLALLFADHRHRPALHALHAFEHEISRVREQVSEPLPGEVRLQWWRDVVEGAGRGEVSGHPVAVALLAAVERYDLPRPALQAMIDARLHDLYDDPFSTVVDLEGYCGETSSALIRLDTLVLAEGSDPGSADASGHAGVAKGVTDLLRALGRRSVRGQLVIPTDVVERHGVKVSDVFSGRVTPQLEAALAEMRRLARHHLAAAERHLLPLPAAVKPAFVPLALVRPVLDRMERPRLDPFRDPFEPPQWLKQWRLWRWAGQH